MCKIEAVTVCVNYADLLSLSLRENIEFFDRYYVVTDFDDEDTYALSEEYDNVVVIRTDEFYHEGAKFAKGRGLNLAMKSVSKNCWVVSIDADILLGSDFNKFKASLDERCRKYMYCPLARVEALSGKRENNYVNCYESAGYLQIFHSDHLTKDFCAKLPQASPNAAFDDLILSQMLNGPSLVDINVYHLDEGERINWSGRITGETGLTQKDVSQLKQFGRI